MLNLIAAIGRKVTNFFREFGQIVILLVRVTRYFPRAVKDHRLVIDQMAIVGSDSLPLVILIGSFTGAIAALKQQSIR
ncbi:hypothetical protein MASR1M45_23160 [Candidatus Kapaibacterium sp.]